MQLTLIAKDPCVMTESGKPTLTVGKEYTPVAVYGRGFAVIDDEGDLHSFGFQNCIHFEPEELAVLKKRGIK